MINSIGNSNQFDNIKNLQNTGLGQSKSNDKAPATKLEGQDSFEIGQKSNLGLMDKNVLSNLNKSTNVNSAESSQTKKTGSNYINGTYVSPQLTQGRDLYEKGEITMLELIDMNIGPKCEVRPQSAVDAGTTTSNVTGGLLGGLFQSVFSGIRFA